MTLHIVVADTQHTDAVATMEGELLHEIMVAVNDKAFGFKAMRCTSKVCTERSRSSMSSHPTVRWG